MAKFALPNLRTLQRVGAATKQVEAWVRAGSMDRPNPREIQRPASSGIPGIILGYEDLATYRWIYRIQITSLKWSIEQHKFVIALPANKNELVWAVNRYEMNNTANVFGHGIPRVQGSATLTPQAIPLNEQIVLERQVGTHRGRPEYIFYAVNRMTVACG